MTKNVLFLCTGNSARSVLAEALLNELGTPRFRAFSAGSKPTGEVNPHTLRTLQRHHLNIEGYRSKSWDEFAEIEAPSMDLIVTVCDDAAAETCPVWPGQPMQVHWGCPDPAQAEGTEDAKMQEFERVFGMIRERILTFLAEGLPAVQA